MDKLQTSPEDLEIVLTEADQAAGAWQNSAPAERAACLEAVADALDVATKRLVPIARQETALSEGRLSGEVGRTSFQLRLFAQVLRDGECLEATVDHPDSSWPPGPRPDVRRMMLPLGPVVVFAASNFPFAFSVVGGDTASALAAGCPVVLKAHPGHPRLSVATAELVTAALIESGAPRGTFAVIFGDEVGRAALGDRRIRAGAFTGSLHVGRLLFDVASSRPDPIPFYGEMGSLNPVFVTSAALAERREEILAGFLASYTLASGQFCTKPGLLFVPASHYAGVLDELKSTVAQCPPAAMLNDRIAAAHEAESRRLTDHPAIHAVVAGRRERLAETTPSLLATTVPELLSNADELFRECFGPTSIIVRYDGDDELLRAACAFEGQLTATVHGVGTEAVAAELIQVLAEHSGRVIWNGWPTGVAVTWAMQHGGPYPATTAPLSTSVGTAAIRRFLRPVAYQSVPDHLLPAVLREGNPLRVPRRVDGVRQPSS